MSRVLAPISHEGLSSQGQGDPRRLSWPFLTSSVAVGSAALAESGVTIDDWPSFASMSWASTGWHSGGILFGWLGRCGWEKLPRNKIRIVHIHAKIHRYTDVWVSMDVWRICTTRISCGYHALVMFEQISISISRCILLPVTIWVIIAHQLYYALVWSRHRSWKQSNSINIHPQFCTLGGEFAVILGLVPMWIATDTHRRLCKARSIQLSPIWLCLEDVCSHPFPVITLQSRHDW